MPVTFFAHQSVVLPAKIRRPQWFDGLALVIGSMAPDFAYPMRGWIQRHGHRFDGMVVWGIPFTLIVTAIVRSTVAGVAFAYLPDLGRIRLRSYRALVRRHPHWAITFSSAVLGVGSHILFDGFTHKQAFLARWFDLDRILWRAPWDSGVSIARTLQYVSHVGGTAVCIMMLASIGRRRLMEEWYGEGAVSESRSFILNRRQRYVFWIVVAAGIPAAGILTLFTRGSIVTKGFVTLAVSTLIACALPYCRPRERPLTIFDRHLQPAGSTNTRPPSTTDRPDTPTPLRQSAPRTPTFTSPSAVAATTLAPPRTDAPRRAAFLRPADDLIPRAVSPATVPPDMPSSSPRTLAYGIERVVSPPPPSARRRPALRVESSSASLPRRRADVEPISQTEELR